MESWQSTNVCVCVNGDGGFLSFSVSFLPDNTMRYFAEVRDNTLPRVRRERDSTINRMSLIRNVLRHRMADRLFRIIPSGLNGKFPRLIETD